MERVRRQSREIGPNGPRERSRSLKQAIYQKLRERIVFLELKPGEFVNETRLASELGVSRTVLREILQRLITDGLLTSTPGQGVYVQGLDLLAIKNAYEMRVPLEGLAGRLAAQRARPEHLDELRKLTAQGEHAAIRQDYREMAHLDWELHRVIAEATRNESLGSTLLHLLIPFNRLWYMAMSEHGKVGNIWMEWREILAALEARNPVLAEKALVEHMTATSSVISPVLSLNPTS
jgi:DNA-binding GntR family transcriptional regulator